MKQIIIVISAALCAVIVSSTAAPVVTTEIFSLDNTQSVDQGKVLSITVDPDTKTVGLAEFNTLNGEQRVILRQNSDNTFTLFPETQPWNWVDHIVEWTKFVRISKIPQVLTAVGGTKQVVEQNYQGKNANSQKWYLVPTGSDPNTGVITNVLLKQCITGQGENQPLTITPCSWSDANQIFSFSLRTTGRSS